MIVSVIVIMVVSVVCDAGFGMVVDVVIVLVVWYDYRRMIVW
jgi:hypothetical protein